jgi:DNA-binding protein HU-beta
VNKKQLVERMSRDSGLTKADANKAVDAFIANVTRALRKGEKVTLVGFGSFRISRHKARAGYNPQTGGALRISAKRFARFAAGNELKAALK